jgi:hypothetical protein
MSTNEVRSNEAAGSTSVANLTMKLASEIRMATAGCCRRSRSGFLGALQATRHTPRRTTLPKRRVAPRWPTGSMKRGLGKPIPTGQIGTPITWCASSPARNCLNKQVDRGSRPSIASTPACLSWPTISPNPLK